MRASTYKLFLPILVLIAFWTHHLNDEPTWGGDYAMYFLHAQNIASDHPYSEMNFIHDESHYWISPVAASPGYPVFLSIFYNVFNLDFKAYKYIQLALLALSSILFFYILINITSKETAITATLLFAFNPYLVNLSQFLATEFLYLVFSMASIFFAIKADKDKQKTHIYILVAASGTFAYFAYATRGIGLLVFLSVFLYYLFNKKKTYKQYLLPLVATFGSGYIFQKLVFEDVHQKINFCIDCITGNVKTYLFSSREFFLIKNITYDIANYIAWAFAAFFFIFVLLGFFSQKIKAIQFQNIYTFIQTSLASITIFDWLILSNIFLISTLDFIQAPRYLFPILPFLFFYFTLGLKNPLINYRLFILTLIPIYILFFATEISTDKREGVINTPTEELFSFYKNDMSGNSVTAFIKPRVLTLFTGKTTTIRDHKNANFSQASEYFKSVNLTHVIVPKKPSILYKKIPNWMNEIDILNKNLPIVFENEYYVVLEVNSLFEN